MWVCGKQKEIQSQQAMIANLQIEINNALLFEVSEFCFER